MQLCVYEQASLVYHFCYSTMLVFLMADVFMFTEYVKTSAQKVAQAKDMHKPVTNSRDANS